jgi:hypothetical protein
MHRKYFEGLRDLLPYNVALIQLDEGPLMMSNLDCHNDQISCNMTVEVFFERVTDEYAFPRFRPATDIASEAS